MFVLTRCECVCACACVRMCVHTQKLQLCCFAAILTRVRTIFVKRDDTDSKIKAAQEIKRRADSDGVWPKVQLFPEGNGRCGPVLRGRVWLRILFRS